MKVCVNEMWIGVCGEGWTMNETDVVCRQLHFNNGGIIPIQLSMWRKVSFFIYLQIIV